MQIEVKKKDIIEALKNVELKGKWASTGGLSSKSLGNYIHIEFQPERDLTEDFGLLIEDHLLLVNSDESTTVIKSIPFEIITCSRDNSFVLEIDTFKKYLSKMNEDITLTVGDTVVMQSDGKTATMPIVVHHPFEGRVNRFIERWRPKSEPYRRPLNFDSDLEEVLKLGVIDVRCGVQVTGEEFHNAIDGCEILNNGIYKLDFHESDELSNPKFIISSSATVSAYREEMVISNSVGESSTVIFSGPLHKFFNKDEIINIFIGDNQPIIMVTENSALIRAPRLGI